MRILSVRFQNLNSLAGSWQIDFTDEAFVREGIFAITGPTGAGKKHNFRRDLFSLIWANAAFKKFEQKRK